MRTTLLVGFVLALVGFACSDEKGTRAPDRSGKSVPTEQGAGPVDEGTAPAETGAVAATGVAVAAAGAAPSGAPVMTPARFVAEPPGFTLEAYHGLWVSEAGAGFAQRCGVDMGVLMARAGKLRGAAKKAPDGLQCEVKGSYAVCAFAMPADQANRDREATWIFTTEEGSTEPELLAVVFGGYDWAKLEPTLPALTPCPRR